VIGDFLDPCDRYTNRDVPHKVYSSAITYQGLECKVFQPFKLGSVVTDFGTAYYEKKTSKGIRKE